MSDVTYPDDRNEALGDAAPAGDASTDPTATDSQASLLHNFGVASLLVVAGVVISGFLLTNEQSAATFDLPAMPVAAWQSEAGQGAGSESWIELAERAFASGRITEPARDNALHYYRQAVMVNSADDRARDGLNNVIGYVIGNAETALYQSDFARARRAAESVLAMLPDHSGAQSVLERTEKFATVEELSRLAVNQLATDRLLSPAGDNALASYRRIERIDPGNAEAAVGIQTIAQRLVAKSQAAAFEGDFEASADYMEKAQGLAPQTSDVAQAAKLTDQFARLTQEKAAEAKADEVAQAEAVQKAAALAEAESGAASTERVFNVSELTVVRSIAPAFPRRAETSEKEGWVELNFRIDTSGGVIDAEVVRSSDPIFESAALSAIRKWEFAPYEENGTATAVRSGVRFSFRQ